MIVDLRVGHWRHQLVVELDEDTCLLLKAEGLGAGASCVVVDNEVVIMEERGCQSIMATRSRTPVPWEWALEFKHFHHHEDLCWFELHPVQGRLEEGVLSLSILPAHELPWPSKRFKLADDEWIYEIYQRLASAKRFGLHGITAPDWVREHRRLQWEEALRSLRNGTKIEAPTEEKRVGCLAEQPRASTAAHPQEALGTAS